MNMSLRDRLVQTITSHPGLVTKQVYEKLGASSVGDMSHIRTELRKMSRSKMFLREQRPSERFGPPTFAYFPGPKLNGTSARYQAAVSTPTPTTTSTPVTPAVTQPMSVRIKELLEQHPLGLNTATIQRKLGATTTGSKLHARRTLQVLAEEGRVYRCREKGGKGSGQGQKPYVYYPRTNAGKQAMNEYIASPTPARTPKRIRTRRDARVTTAKAPATTTTGRIVELEQTVRVNFPFGQHEMTMDFARQLYNQLAELFVE